MAKKKNTPEIPIGRQARFDAALIRKYCRRFPGFDDKIIALYARGMSAGDIQRQIREIYAIDISPDLVWTVTDSIPDEVMAWQAQPLAPSYAIVFFDAVAVKIRDEDLVKNKAVHLALGIRPCGHKQVLGLWIDQGEGAKFWMRVMSEIKSRGAQDILIAVGDDWSGFPEAISAIFPKTVVQTCIVHLIRHSLQFASWEERRPVASALRHIYYAHSAEGAAVALELFAQDDWGRKYPAIVESWRRHWQSIIPFFALPPGVRKIIYTTNAIESLNASVRKAVRHKAHFPNDQAAMKLIWLALRNVVENWKNPPMSWRTAQAQLASQFQDRFVVSE
jgi:putative transposase